MKRTNISFPSSSSAANPSKKKRVVTVATVSNADADTDADVTVIWEDLPPELWTGNILPSMRYGDAASMYFVNRRFHYDDAYLQGLFRPYQLKGRRLWISPPYRDSFKSPIYRAMYVASKLDDAEMFLWCHEKGVVLLPVLNCPCIHLASKGSIAILKTIFCRDLKMAALPGANRGYNNNRGPARLCPHVCKESNPCSALVVNAMSSKRNSLELLKWMLLEMRFPMTTRVWERGITMGNVEAVTWLLALVRTLIRDPEYGSGLVGVDPRTWSLWVSSVRVNPLLSTMLALLVEYAEKTITQLDFRILGMEDKMERKEIKENAKEKEQLYKEQQRLLETKFVDDGNDNPGTDDGNEDEKGEEEEEGEEFRGITERKQMLLSLHEKASEDRMRIRRKLFRIRLEREELLLSRVKMVRDALSTKEPEDDVVLRA